MPIHPMWENFPAIKDDLAESYAVMEKKFEFVIKKLKLPFMTSYILVGNYYALLTLFFFHVLVATQRKNIKN